MSVHTFSVTGSQLIWGTLGENAGCDTAFRRFDDNHVQVACQTDDVSREIVDTEGSKLILIPAGQPRYNVLLRQIRRCTS